MRGKVVVDAVLSNPSVLIVQKKDYSWLGIPNTEGGIKRNLPTEEGIDHRTRIRRLAREEAAVRSVGERDDAAREAAEMGYFVSESSQGDDLQETRVHSRGTTDSNSFFCMNEGKHSHHCVDKGVDYEMKHGDLEKPFRVKFPGSSGLKFWSRLIKRHWKHTFKRKSKRSDISASGVAIKRRILENSASAARSYFHSHSMNPDTHLVKNDVDKITESAGCGDDDKCIVAEHVDRVDVLQPEDLTKTLPVTLDAVHFRGATVMLLAYEDIEVR
jgi:hypothetical protein